MTLAVRPIAYDDVTVAAVLVRDGSLTPEAERVDDVEGYWAAVLETRARGGDVLVADLDGDIVGASQVMIFQYFQHVGIGAANSRVRTYATTAEAGGLAPRCWRRPKP